MRRFLPFPVAPCAGYRLPHRRPRPHRRRRRPRRPPTPRRHPSLRLHHPRHRHLGFPMEASSYAPTRALFRTMASAMTVVLVLRLGHRPRPSLTYQTSARGRMGAPRASLSAAFTQASTAPRRTPLFGLSSHSPTRWRGSVRLTRQARAPGCGPTALRGTTPTGFLVSQTTLAGMRIVPTSTGSLMRQAPGTMRLVYSSSI